MSDSKPVISYSQLMKHAPKLTVSRFVQVLAAAHLSYKVKGFAQDRGGIIVVGPPGTLKSTLISSLREYGDAMELSDVNVQTLAKLRDSIAAQRWRTLVFPEMAKLYERHPNVASNIEGTIRSMVAEGFKQASFESTRVNRPPARCLVVGAITTDTMSKMSDKWEDSGFARRFLWPTIRYGQDKLDAAVDEWKLIDFKMKVPMVPNGAVRVSRIPHIGVTMRALCQYQPGSGRALQTSLLRRIFSVLCWHHRRAMHPEQEAMRTLLAFGRALGEDGTEVI